MSVTRTVNEESGVVTVKVSNRFDFSVHTDFRAAFAKDDSGRYRYIIDLTDVSYLDSSALGMLLVLRDHAGGKPDRVSLKVRSGEIEQILSITNFQKLFVIEKVGA